MGQKGLKMERVEAKKWVGEQGFGNIRFLRRTDIFTPLLGDKKGASYSLKNTVIL